MSKLIIPFNFERQNKEPLDVDYKVETLIDLETLKSKGNIYTGQQAYCVEDSTLYIYIINLENLNHCPTSKTQHLTT